jgi:adenosylhomocysteine nucleosidase
MRVVVASSKRELFLDEGNTVGVGLVEATLNTSNLINNKNINHIVVVGTCGAINVDFAVGDLIVGSLVVNYGLDLSRFKINKGETFNKEGAVVGPIKLKEIRGNSINRKVHHNVVVGSSDQFLVAKNREPILKDLGIDVVDMESYAVARVASFYNIDVSVVRVVSDNYKGHRPKNFKSFLEEAVKDIHLFLN